MLMVYYTGNQIVGNLARLCIRSVLLGHAFKNLPGNEYLIYSLKKIIRSSLYFKVFGENYIILNTCMSCHILASLKVL